jgi:hypothetical protein
MLVASKLEFLICLNKFARPRIILLKFRTSKYIRERIKIKREEQRESFICDFISGLILTQKKKRYITKITV